MAAVSAIVYLIGFGTVVVGRCWASLTQRGHHHLTQLLQLTP